MGILFGLQSLRHEKSQQFEGLVKACLVCVCVNTFIESCRCSCGVQTHLVGRGLWMEHPAILPTSLLTLALAFGLVAWEKSVEKALAFFSLLLACICHSPLHLGFRMRPTEDPGC